MVSNGLSLLLEIPTQYNLDHSESNKIVELPNL